MGLGALQPGHLIVILVIVLLIFGPGKLPELGRAMGDGLRELKKATTGDEPKDGATHPATALPSAPATTAVVNPGGTVTSVTPANGTNGTVTTVTPISAAAAVGAHTCPS